MFCRKCGLKIQQGVLKCRKCGEPVGTAEYCGGFWGIVGLNRHTQGQSPEGRSREDLSGYYAREIEKMKAYDMEKEGYYLGKLKELKDKNEEHRLWRRKTVLIIAILGLAALFFCLFSFRESMQIEKMKQEISSQSEDISVKKKKIRRLRKELSDLKKRQGAEGESGIGTDKEAGNPADPGKGTGTGSDREGETGPGTETVIETENVKEGEDNAGDSKTDT